MEETTNNTQSANGGGNEGGRWAWVVTGVVALALVFGFYSWPKKGGEESAQAPTNTEETDEYTASLNNVTTSDEVADIEKDLNETNIDNLDKEVSDLEAEVNAQ